MNKNTSQRQIYYSLLPFLLLATDDSVGRIVRQLRWTNQEFSTADIIFPPLFSMLIYHLGGEQTIGSLVAAVQRRGLTLST
jgi:hypothetical protein